MENKVVKNMDYWKKKNNIPGIEALADAGLTDGRAGSSAFQMATPGSSPNKNFFKKALGFLNPLKGGPLGALARGIAPNSKLVSGLTNPFGLGGGPGLGAVGGAFGGVGGMMGGGGAQAAGLAQAAVPEENPMAAVPVQTPMTMRSPMKQEEMMMEEKPAVDESSADPTERIYVSDQYEAGDLISEDDLEEAFTRTGNNPKDYPQLAVQDYSEVRVSETGVKYVEKLKPGEEIKGLETGDTMGGVGDAPTQMASPYKNYRNPQDYKVFNFGNEPTPFEKLKKKKY